MGSYLVLIRHRDGRLSYGIEDSIGDTVQSRIFHDLAHVQHDWDDERQEVAYCRCPSPDIEVVDIFTTYAGGSFWEGKACTCGHLVFGIAPYDEAGIDVCDGIPLWVPWQTPDEVFAHQKDGLTAVD